VTAWRAGLPALCLVAIGARGGKFGIRFGEVSFFFRKP